MAWLQSPLQSWSYPPKRCHISPFHLYSWPNPHLCWHRNSGNHTTGAVSVNWCEILWITAAWVTNRILQTCLSKDFYARRLSWIDLKHAISCYLTMEFKNKSENIFLQMRPLGWRGCTRPAVVQPDVLPKSPRWRQDGRMKCSAMNIRSAACQHALFTANSLTSQSSESAGGISPKHQPGLHSI